MRDRALLVLLIGGGLLLAAGCASERQWTTWTEHPTHFASRDHWEFSTSERAGRRPRITPEDLAKAQAQGWWGLPVPPDPALLNLTGRWSGSWSASGLLRSVREGAAEATFDQTGSVWIGNLALVDAMVAYGVPVALRESNSFGVPIWLDLSESDELLVSNSSEQRPFTAAFRLKGNDRLVGSFVNAGAPVHVELIRQP